MLVKPGFIDIDVDHGRIEAAKASFDEMPEREVEIIVVGLCSVELDKAFHVFDEMKRVIYSQMVLQSQAFSQLACSQDFDWDC